MLVSPLCARAFFRESPPESVFPILMGKMVSGNGCAIYRCSRGLRRSYWSVMRDVGGPLKGATMDGEVHLVQRVVVQIEPVQNACRTGGSMCVMWLMHRGEVVWVE